MSDQSDEQAQAQAEIFGFFNEIGIISQLSNALLAKVLPQGIHPSHFAILNHMSKRGDGNTPVRIANAMQVTKATMTHSLNVLEARGYVITRPSPEDARSKTVHLTVEGRDFVREAAKAVTTRFADLIGEREMDAIRTAMPSLITMRKHLDENR